MHLCFSPPFAPGSYNPLVGALVRHDSALRQVAISYWEGPLPPADEVEGTVVVGPGAPSSMASAALRLPERLRQVAYEGMGSRERIRYALEVTRLLMDHPPPVVVIWDDYKLGPFLRRHTDLASAIVLSQHGRSYHLSPAAARNVYRLDTLDAVITLTHASYRADRSGLYAYEALVLVRPNGVDAERFRPSDDATRAAARARWALPEEAPVVLALARLAPSKGVHLLLHSWPRIVDAVPDAVLWLVGSGDGEYGQGLRQMVDCMSLTSSVRFAGAVDRDQVADCHAAADLYVFPSVQDEGHPLSVLEAMASGLACVASDSPVLRELHTGAVELVDDPNIEDAFVAPVIRLLTDRDERRALGERARRQVLERFTLGDYLDEVTAFLVRLAGSRGDR